MMRTPRPRQALHFWTAPDFPPWLKQSTFLLSCSLVVLKEDIHLSGCIMSSPLLLPFRLLL
uniref:Uncharacterized protein n=1 Tax=Saimiri boliviensis boliviensis TaxID=39432 RepID=A0A2K6V1X9_SAIBB